jgi:FkbH-like protein
MKAIVGRFDSVARARITQLINKTNQFNLTTRRYTESQIMALEDSSEGLTLQIRLVDKFGDNGIVAIVICVPDGPDWVIDTWLMSCRVLNRKLEETTLNCIMAAAKSAGVRTVVGHFRRPSGTTWCGSTTRSPGSSASATGTAAPAGGWTWWPRRLACRSRSSSWSLLSLRT